MDEKLENVRQWQRHYRKAFPEFVFYFESVPHDVRLKCLKQLDALGAVSIRVASCKHTPTSRIGLT